MSFRRLVFVTSSLFAAGLAQAETVAPVVVTATRFAASIDTAPVNVTVISAEDIANSSATTLAEVLKYQPGVHVSELFGISGSRASVDMGGFGQNGGQNTLVLLNGRRLNDVDLQGANLASIPLDGIAQIEIVHGTSTVLYGDNAVGGVINIVTKSGFDGEHASAKISMGSYHTKRLSTDVRGTRGDTALSMAFEGLKSDGYRDNSAFTNVNIMGEASRESGNKSYGLRLNSSREKTDLPGALNEPLYKDDPTQSSGTIENAKESRYSVDGFLQSDAFAGELTLSNKHQEASYYADVSADLRTLSFTPRIKREAGSHAIIAGADFYRSRLEADSASANFFPPPATSLNASETTRNSYAVYVTDSISVNERTSLNLGARKQWVKLSMDNNSNIAGHSRDARNDVMRAADITLSHKHNYGGQNYVRLARSFRSPVLDEMWSYTTGSISLLKPQTGNHLEIGTRQSFGNDTQLNANVFRMNLTDEIAFDNVLYANVNLDKTRHDGLNLDVSTKLNRELDIKAGYAYRKATFRAGSNDGNTVPLVPKHKLSLSGRYQATANDQLGIDAIRTGSRYFGDDNANVGKQLPAYNRLDMSYTHQTGKWKERLSVQNVTNVKTADSGYYYYDALYAPIPYNYYPLPERAFYLSLEGEL